jgi:diguanylate cyclase (GGDEF)-like protein
MILKPKKLPTLLLITSSPIVRNFFEMVIDKLEDYALLISESQLETLEHLEKTEISFIVIDEKTTNLQLRPLCEEIRRYRNYGNIPILIITNHLKKSFTKDLIQAGATDFLRQPLDEDEFLLRMDLAQDVMTTQAKIAGLTRHLAKQTASTPSLENRSFLDDRAIRLIHEAISGKTALALILLEIDQYGQILNSSGENVAHALTLDLEDQMTRLMRAKDLLYNQNRGRFAIFLPKTSCKASAFIAENILEYLDTEIFHAGNISFTVTASMGIATLEQTGDPTKNDTINLERLINEAQICLNQAKKKKNTIISYSQKRETPS